MPYVEEAVLSVVNTPLAPAAIGPYSQAIMVDRTLYCSGQIALNPGSASLISGSVADETERVLQNIGAILNAVSLDYSSVVQCRVYLVDMHDFAQVNEVYAQYFNEMPPARETVEVRGLPRGARVEISCVAVR